MAVTVTNTNIATFNTDTSLTKNAATSSTIDQTEVFTITPTKPDHKVVVVIENGSGQGALGWSVAAGDYWAAGSALTGSAADGGSDVVVLEGGKYKDQDGKIAITLTPASGKRLLTDHAAKVAVIQLP